MVPERHVNPASVNCSQTQEADQVLPLRADLPEFSPAATRHNDPAGGVHGVLAAGHVGTVRGDARQQDHPKRLAFRAAQTVDVEHGEQLLACEGLRPEPRRLRPARRSAAGDMNDAFGRAGELHYHPIACVMYARAMRNVLSTATVGP